MTSFPKSRIITYPSQNALNSLALGNVHTGSYTKLYVYGMRLHVKEGRKLIFSLHC